MKEIEDFRSTINQLDGQKFIESLPKICKEMHNDLKILTFGIIVYDQRTPEFRKMLRDNDYWDALEKASGDRMVIFALPDTIERKLEINTRIGLMVRGQPISNDVGKSYSSLIKSLFDKESNLVYPSVIFFQVVADEIYDYRLVPLEENDIHQSFKAVKELFLCISGVLANVTAQHYGNRKEIFNLVKDELLTRKYTLYILHGAKKLSQLIDVLKAVIIPH